MGFGGFSQGFEKGQSDEMDRQEDKAFKLKLQNAQIEGQIRAQAAQYENESRLSQKVTKAAGDYAGFDFGGAATKDQPVMDALIKARSNSDKRLQGGSARGMTVADFEDARGVKTGMDPKRWLNPTEVNVWQSRLSSEKATPEVMNTYRQQLSGFKLLDQLETMRNDALKEVKEGVISGRIANIAVAADQGTLYPRAAAYQKFVQSQLANLAHFSGEVGRLAEGDIDRAGNISADFATSSKTAKLLFDASRETATNNMKTSEDLFPQLRRMRETEAHEMGLKSKAAAEEKTQAKILSGEGFLKFMKAKADKEEAEKAAKRARP